MLVARVVAPHPEKKGAPMNSCSLDMEILNKDYFIKWLAFLKCAGKPHAASFRC